jgi:hypothetical protein
MIYVTGDKHGDIDFSSLSSENFPEGKALTKSDYLIICGDFGVIWDQTISGTEQYLKEWYGSKPWTTLFIDGNHENFDRLSTLPVEEKFGSVVGKVSDSIYHLRRGKIYSIDGRKFFTFGGASSVDKNRRIHGVSWWPQELPSYEEQEHGLINLEIAERVDYIITHIGPLSIFNDLKSMNLLPSGQLDKQAGDLNLMNYFEIVREKLVFKKWFFGHYHEDIKLSEQFHLLYHDKILLE